MSFMSPVITDKALWLRVESDHGVDFIPCADCGIDRNSVRRLARTIDREGPQAPPAWLRSYMTGNTVQEVACVYAYGVRLSAPGYMDATDWEAFTVKRDAMRRFRELERETQEGAP